MSFVGRHYAHRLHQCVWIVAYQVGLFIPSTKCFSYSAPTSNYIRVWFEYRIETWFVWYVECIFKLPRIDFISWEKAQEQVISCSRVCLGVLNSQASPQSQALMSFLNYKYDASQQYRRGNRALAILPYNKIWCLPPLKISRARLQSPSYWILPISGIARKSRIATHVNKILLWIPKTEKRELSLWCPVRAHLLWQAPALAPARTSRWYSAVSNITSSLTKKPFRCNTTSHSSVVDDIAYIYAHLQPSPPTSSPYKQAKSLVHSP